MNYLEGNVCIFGDSIVWGWGSSEFGGWTHKLLAYAHNVVAGENIVYSLGMPGETTEGLLKRIKSESYARTPNTIIIASGLNDCRYNKVSDKRAVEVEEFKKNIAEIIKIAREFTKKIVFIGLTKVNEKHTIPIIWNADEMYKNEDIKKYNDELQQICIREEIKFIDVIDLLNIDDIDAIDGLHPNIRGHEKMFKHIKEQLI